MAPSAPVSGPPPPPGAESEGGPPLPSLEGEKTPQKRKATSFKITNVFLSHSLANDGDDSCEDKDKLEDSRTEDLPDIVNANSLNSLNSLSSKFESLNFVNNPVIVNGWIQRSRDPESNGSTVASTKHLAEPAKTKFSPGQQPKEASAGSKKPPVTEGRGRKPSWDKVTPAYKAF